MQQHLIGRSRNVFEEIRLRGNEDYFIPMECEQPCHHEPGSVEKIKTFRARLERGEELFHPMDTTRHATHEQINEAREFVASELLANDDAPAHVRHRRERKLERESIQSSADYVTAHQLKSELGIASRAVDRYLRNQNPRFRMIRGTKYYLRSSLTAID